MPQKGSIWDKRYRTGRTGWNIGYISTPLQEYIDQLTDKQLKILIPGGGNSYEAEYLFKLGFPRVYVADISKYPLQNLLQRVPDFPKNQLLHTDFFELEGSFDRVLEQTFFCAISPDKRRNYRDKVHNLLHPEGKLVGLLFDFPLTEQGPPFGGDKEAYQKLFTEKFNIQVLKRAYNSIPPRAGKELFIIAEKNKSQRS